MKKILAFAVILLHVFVLSSGAEKTKRNTRILFIPLDARPPCLKLTEKMGLIANAEVVSPPLELLGDFHDPGQSDKINEWILSQDLKSFDAAIVVVDMVAYGGLVASRKFLIESPQALARVEVLKQMKQKAPSLPIYVQNVIMRLAPNSDGKNEAYREKLHTWAKISPDQDQTSRSEVAKLEQEIPSWALADYKRARERNYKTNLKIIDFVKKGYVNYLILSQDDATPKGVHLTDRENLISEVEKLGLTEKVAVQPGADEVSMLLLARVLNNHLKYSPKIKAVYSSEKLRTTVMPFEDRSLNVTVSHHIKAVGAIETKNEREADLLFYVFPSRHEPGVAEKFAAEIESKVNAGKKVIVADIDPIGDVQGGDTGFTEALEKRHLFAKLNGYASWNTAGNTIGTALPHGVVFALAQAKLLSKGADPGKIMSAQNWFMINRVIDDYYYHNLVRAQANAFLTGKNRKNSSALMSDADNAKVEVYALGLMEKHLATFSENFFTNNKTSRTQCARPSELTFQLPWNRTFEADIDFKLTCKTVN